MHRIPRIATPAVVLAALLAAPLASATAASFVDIDDESFFRVLDPGETVSGTFDIVNPGDDCLFVLCDHGGFDPATQQLDQAVVAFTFLDYGDLELEIDLGQGSQVLAQATDSWFLHIEFEWLNADALGDLGDDGQLAWSVTNTETSVQTASASCYSSYCGDGSEHGDDGFVLKFAKLGAVTAPVPEPGSALLFAAGFGVVGGTIRRYRRR